jgi:preflagellin peptidase FlaK
VGLAGEGKDDSAEAGPEEITCIILLHRIVIALIMLGIASYLDLKSREVPDKFWIPFFVIGALLTGFDFVNTPGYDILQLAVAIGLTSALSWAAYFLHLYGGADAKAITTLSLLLPIYNSATTFHSFGALTTFTNSILLSVLLPIFFLLLNLSKIARGEKIFKGFEDSTTSKIKAVFLGTRRKQAGRFDYSLEKVIEGKRRFNISLGKIDEDFATGKDIWVSPGIPLLVFVLLGFIATVSYGDLLFTMLSSIFSIIYRT